MAVRWRDPGTFRASPTAAPRPRPSARQSIALLAVLVLVGGAVAAVSYLVRPDRAKVFALLHGSLFLSDSVAPVAIDLASGRPTVRLLQAAQQVGAGSTSDLSVLPLDSGTLLLNRATGEFNMVAATGFVVKTDGGVPIAERQGAVGAVGIASGSLAYIEQTGPTGTSVYLVGQSTVESAGVVAGKVRPRALRSMPEAGSTAPGAAVAADGDLWLLVGSGRQRTVRRLHLPVDSSPGAVLASSDHGRVPAVSALESTDDGAVGVATSDRIRVYGADGTTRTVHFRAIAGADSVLAASDARGRLAYLVHGSDGWHVVSVAADGTGLRGPTRLSLRPGADPAPPATSGTALYTLDRRTGQVLRIGIDGAVSGDRDYPLARQDGRVIEAGGFDDAYVIARDSRVVVNSPGHLNALVLFTDGSHAPLVIAKSSAVSVNAAAGAAALTRSRRAAATKDPRRTAPQPQAAAPVNNAAACRTARQKPHIPSIVGAVPGSRSVLLSWSYPTPDPQDCQPSTYVVGVRALSDGAPAPPSSVTVQGQTSVNLAGLFPSTQYEVTVTAYIHGQGTASAPRRVTTGPEGPAAARGVTATADAAGNWDVTWTSCGTVTQGCVPAASWKVIPEFCDGLGLSGAPAALSVTADPTSKVQPPAQLRGGDALLGRGLRFQVEGIGANNAVGDPSGYTACTYSWTSPVADDLEVSASTPPATDVGATTTTTATVRFAQDRTHDLGGVGGTLTYQLLGPDGSVLSTEGPTTDDSVELGGIAPGEQYSVRVVVTPPHHPEAAVRTTPVPVQPAFANWPTPDVHASFDDGGSALGGTLSVSFGLGGADVRGETFDLAGGSELRCANTTLGLDRSDVTPGQSLSFDVDRFRLNGPCRVALVLDQHGATATDPPLFGSSSSPPSSDSVQIPAPATSTERGDFSATWDDSYSPRIDLTYDGHDRLDLATNWSIVATGSSGADCGSAGNGPTVTIAIDPSCVTQGGNVTVSVAYDYPLPGQQQTFTGLSVGGTPPHPVQPGDVSFTASWDGDASNPSVRIGYTGNADRSDLHGLSWTETVTSNGTTCGRSHADPGDGDVAVPVDYSTCPATGPFAVTIHYEDDTYGGSQDYTPPIEGNPPH